ncbi:MAG: biotin transporter BioY [Chloroflexota bacterium]|nr:biotin transporter BioY [Dehalococcoidia bacterium]MDW8252390.1 biotin transporter BioY [Chloroflexota bacterium]
MATKAALAVLFSVLIAISAQVSFEIGPVPITLQTLMVLLTGALLGSRLGALAVALYLAEGLAGLPVFAGGNSAWSVARTGGPYILGSTAGYLVGFVAAAFLVGWLAERGWTRTVLLTALAMVLGNLVIYALGLLNLARFVPPPTLFAVGLLPFLPGDAIKIAVAVALLPGGWKLLEAVGLHPRR